MSLLPIKKGINFSGMELYEILLKVDFDALVEFLNSRGGLNGVEEYGRTALMELTIGRVRDTVESWNRQEGGLYAQEGRNELMRAFFLRCQDFSLEYLLQFENEFAQKLVDLGCDINQRDRYGYTALRYAVQDKNYAMAEYLLSRPGVELQDVTPSMDDRMDSILVRGGCDIFTPRTSMLQGCKRPFLDGWLSWHQGKGDTVPWMSCWRDFSQTLAAVREMYPDRLPEIPPFYLDTVEYDFLMQDFSGPTARPFASKKAMTAFLKGLERGLDSRDEMGRNLLSCCALLYRHYSGDRRFQADARRAEKRAGELLAMGISLTQPDFAGKTPQDHLSEAGLTGLQP
jgi:hypothetical protein